MKKRPVLISLLVSLFLGSTTFLPLVNANEFACQRVLGTYPKDPIWTISGEKNLKFLASWSFRDPENCIVGMQGPNGSFGDNRFQYSDGRNTYKFPTTWHVSRDGEMALVTGETEFSLPLLLSLSNKNLNGYGSDLSPRTQDFSILTWVKVRKGSGYDMSLIGGKYGLTQVWGNWFSKSQGIHPKNCNPDNHVGGGLLPERKFTHVSRIIESGPRPKIEITIQDPNDCIFLVHAGPLSPYKELNGESFRHSNYALTLAEYPYWHGESAAFFDSILSRPDQVLQVGVGLETSKSSCGGGPDYSSCGSKGSFIAVKYSDITLVSKLPVTTLTHTDSVSRVGNAVKVITSIDASQFNSSSKESLTLYLGTYRWFTEDASTVPGGWRVSTSGNTWTARYSEGGSLPGGWFPSYYTTAISFPIADLVTTAAEKAAAEKAAAEKAAAEKAAAEKAAAEKAAAEKAAAEKAAAEKAAAEKAAAEKAAAEKAAKKRKSATIICTKGKITMKIISMAVNPTCPTGYKKK
jgi:hypothetical protein